MGDRTIIHGQSPVIPLRNNLYGDYNRQDFVVLECLRSNGQFRVAPPYLLIRASEFFMQQLTKVTLYGSISTSVRFFQNRLYLDVSITTLDIILWYLSTGQQFYHDNKHVIEVYAAAKRYGFTNIMQKMEEMINSNIENCLHDNDFLDRSKFAVDVDMVAEVFARLPSEAIYKSKLMERLNEWSENDAEKSGIVTKIYRVLFPAQSTLFTGEPRRVRPRRSSGVAIFSKKPSNNSSSVTFLPSGVTCRGICESAKLTPASGFIMNDQHYFTIAGKVYVRRVRSQELPHEVRVLSTIGQPFVRTNVFGTAAFFYTPTEIYAFDAQNMNLVKIAENIRFRYNDHTILSYDHNECTIAVAIQPLEQVWTFTYRRGDTTAYPSYRMQIPKNMKLIGGHNGLLYFCSIEGPRWVCAAYSGYAEIKQIDLGDIVGISDHHICDDFVYMLISRKDDSAIERQHVYGLDFNFGKVIFKKSFKKLGLQEAGRMIPVVA